MPLVVGDPWGFSVSITTITVFIMLHVVNCEKFRENVSDGILVSYNSRSFPEVLIGHTEGWDLFFGTLFRSNRSSC